MGNASMKSSRPKPNTPPDDRRSFSPMHSTPSSITDKHRSAVSTSNEKKAPPPFPPPQPTLVEDLEFLEERVVDSSIGSESSSDFQKIDTNNDPKSISASAPPVARQRNVRTRVVKSLRSSSSYETNSSSNQTSSTDDSNGQMQASTKNKEELRDVMTWIFQPNQEQRSRLKNNRSKFPTNNRPDGVYEHETVPKIYP